jgi:hypothetical protein
VVQDCLKLCKYLMEVLETMPDSHWKQQTMVRTEPRPPDKHLRRGPARWCVAGERHDGWDVRPWCPSTSRKVVNSRFCCSSGC